MKDMGIFPRKSFLNQNSIRGSFIIEMPLYEANNIQVAVPYENFHSGAWLILME